MGDVVTSPAETPTRPGRRTGIRTALVSGVLLIGMGAFVVAALVASLRPPKGPQVVGDLRLAVATEPDPPRIGANRVEVRLSDSTGRPVTNAELDLKVGLEGASQLLRYPITPAGEGRFQAEVNFTMPGPWRATVTVRREGRPDLEETAMLYLTGEVPRITGTVRLAPALAARLSPGDVLFVLARQGEGGPPLAVKRFPRPTFPLRYTLSAEDVMLAGVPFAGEVRVVALIKKGGAAGPPGPGDLEGTRSSGPVKVGASGVDITIDRVY